MKLASSYLRITISYKVYYSWYSYFIMNTFLKSHPENSLRRWEGEGEQGKEGKRKERLKKGKGTRDGGRRDGRWGEGRGEGIFYIFQCSIIYSSQTALFYTKWESKLTWLNWYMGPTQTKTKKNPEHLLILALLLLICIYVKQSLKVFMGVHFTSFSPNNDIPMVIFLIFKAFILALEDFYLQQQCSLKAISNDIIHQ